MIEFDWDLLNKWIWEYFSRNFPNKKNSVWENRYQTTQFQKPGGEFYYDNCPTFYTKKFVSFHNRPTNHDNRPTNLGQSRKMFSECTQTFRGT